MRKLLTCIPILMLTLSAGSQIVIENPRHGISSGYNFRLLKIELNDTSTVLFFHYSSAPGSSMSIPKNTYISSAGSLEKLYIKTTEGVPLGQSIPTPTSGAIDYKLIFPRLDPAVSLIDYGEEGGTWHIYDIALKTTPASKSAVPKEFYGHWFNTADGEWIISLLDTVVVFDKNLWKYDVIKGNSREVTISISGKSLKTDLRLKADKDGHLTLTTPSKAPLVLGKDVLAIRKSLKRDEELFTSPVFKYDSVVFSGYLKGYTKRTGVTAGTLYVNNILTGAQDNFLIRIAGNGYFSVKIPLYYPHDVLARCDLISGSFYLEPGKDLFMMIDPDQPDLPLFMGENALLNADYRILADISAFNYKWISGKILGITPSDYKDYLLEVKKKELNMLDSVTATRPFTAKGVQLKKLGITYRNLYSMLEYSMLVEGAIRAADKIPSSKKALPVEVKKPGVDYYDFLTDDLSNNPLGILVNDYYYFINRLKYNELSRNISSGYTISEIAQDLIRAGFPLTEEEKEMAADLKANYNPDANARIAEFLNRYGSRYDEFSRKHREELDKIQGTTKNQPPTTSAILKVMSDNGVELTDEERKMLEIRSAIFDTPEFIKNHELMVRYKDQIARFNENHSKEISFLFSQRIRTARHRSIEKNFNIKKGFATDIMDAQDYCKTIVGESTPLASEQIRFEKEQIGDEFISWYIEKRNNETASRLAAYSKKLPASGDKLSSVVLETPKTKEDNLFETIINKYKGKVVYVDFWATWCGPCRSENERIKPLKEELAGRDIVFVYITNQTSPKETYANMIPTIPGEHYRVTSDEWSYLTGKFNISGIPHTVLVDRNGNVVDPNLKTYQNNLLKIKLEKLLN